MNKSALLMPYVSKHLSRSLAVAAILVVVALSIGGALGERLEQRAAEDRLSFGETETCVATACSTNVN